MALHRRGAVVVAAVTMIAGALGGSVAALFTDSEPVAVPVTIAPPIVPAPTNVACQTVTVLLTSRARASWVGAPGATGYNVYIQGVAGAVNGATPLPASARTFDITGSLVNNLVGFLFGTQRQVTVTAVYTGGGHTYESAGPANFQIVATLLPLGVSCSTAGAAAQLVATTGPATTTTATTTTTTLPTPASSTAPADPTSTTATSTTTASTTSTTSTSTSTTTETAGTTTGPPTSGATTTAVAPITTTTTTSTTTVAPTATTDPTTTTSAP